MDYPIFPKNMTREQRADFLQHHLDVAINHIRNLEEALRQAASIEVNSGEENARLVALVAQLKAKVSELGAENDRLKRSEYMDGRLAYNDGFSAGHRQGYGDALSDFHDEE